MREGNRVAAVLDLVNALRNVGVCEGKLGMHEFDKGKMHLTAALDLVSSSEAGVSDERAIAEQEIVLEIGNLWFDRYTRCLILGRRFFAEEALTSAERWYRESRDLCLEIDPEKAPRTSLFRSEYNLGMVLVAGSRYREALRPLQAAAQAYQESVKPGARTGAGEGNDEELCRGLYASSLALLAECHVAEADDGNAGQKAGKAGNAGRTEAVACLEAALKEFRAVGDGDGELGALQALAD
ncbi:unnamed protein product, partial [Discosporangium mesarthrocarpum]